MLQADAISDLLTTDLKQVLDYVKAGPDAQQILVLGQAIQASFIEFSLSQTELGWHLIGAVVLQLVRHLSPLLTTLTGPSASLCQIIEMAMTTTISHVITCQVLRLMCSVDTIMTHTHFAILRILQPCILGLSRRAPITQVPWAPPYLDWAITTCTHVAAAVLS